MLQLMWFLIRAIERKISQGDTFGTEAMGDLIVDVRY